MADKISLLNLSNTQASTIVSNTNANNAALIAALNNTLSRDGSAPNQMQAFLDMNSFKIINLPVPTTATEPVRKDQLDALAAAVLTGSALTLTPVFTNTSLFNASDVILGIFSNYTSIDGVTSITDLPLGSTKLQANGYASYLRVHANNISPGNGGLGVNYFGAVTVEGQGISSSSTSAGWFGNGAIADDHTPGHYYSSATFRELIGTEMDFYVYHDDTTVVGRQLAGNSWVQPAQSLGYVVGNMAQVHYWTGTTNGTTTVSALTNAASIVVNGPVSGAGIPAKTYVVSVNVGAATMVMSQAATGSASGVVMTNSIPWDIGFLSQAGAGSIALLAGALDGNPAPTTGSYSQYVQFGYNTSGGVSKSTSLQVDTIGDLNLTGGGLHIPAQTSGGASSYSDYLTMTYGNGSSVLNATLNVSPLGLWTFSGGISLNGSTSGATAILAPAIASGAWILQAATDTFVGRATPDTLTNKSLTSPVISGGTIDNATIGATTASTIKATTISASGQITSTLAIGTAPFVITSTTNVPNLNASTLSGATFASPGAIGSGVASTGAFTTVTASSTISEGGSLLTTKYAQLVSSNTFTALQTITVDDAVNNSTSDIIALNHTTSGTAAAGIGIRLPFGLENGSGTLITPAASIAAVFDVVTAAAETAHFNFNTRQAGAIATRLTIGAGVFTLNATGGDKGIDTINATTLYEQGTSLVTKYAALGTANTFAGAILSSSPSGGVGYATGAGGTVTQASSRTTGVTINKTAGAITMFSAAGLVTATTFTVTNSSVVATDTIILNQKSGTNLYNLLITAVAAGSFNITFYTTGGVATDTPVINFSVIKSVTA